MSISWHESFANLLDLYLTPVGIKVYPENPVMSRPPESDLLLLRHEGRATEAQKKRLCDGLRDSTATHILIEFKYSESVGKMAICKAVGYDAFYRESKELKQHQLQTFIVSSKTPSSRFVRECGYVWAQEGIMKSNHLVLQPIQIISLNDLPDTPHNALFKVFASKYKQITTGFDRIVREDIVLPGSELLKRIAAFHRAVFDKEYPMNSKTLDDYERISLALAAKLWRTLPAEERLRNLSVEERFQGVSYEERLQGVPAENRLHGLSDEERIHGMSDEVLLQIMENRKRKQSRP